MKNWGRILYTAVTIGLMACSGIKDDQTGVTITGNTASIKGHVILENGATLSKKSSAVNSVWDSTVVSLLQTVDTGIVVKSMFVDSSGGYLFEDLSAGVYSLEARLPNGTTFTRLNISLKSNESLVVNLSRSGGAVNDSIITWELDITCGDSGNTAVLYGPWNPGTGAVVRLLEQPWERFYGDRAVAESRGTKIAVQFPKEVWEEDSSIQILVGLEGRNSFTTIENVEPVTGEKLPEMLLRDSIPNRRLKITWKEAGPECILLDSLGLPKVSCKPYRAPEYSSMEEVASEIGTLFRDLVNDLGTSDSIDGYLFPDSIVRGGGDGTQTLLDYKAYLDTTTTPEIPLFHSGFLIAMNPTFYDSIPWQVLQGLNADSLKTTIKVGAWFNTSEYWNDVPGMFYDSYVTPFVRNAVPFDSSGRSMFDLELNSRYKRSYNYGRSVAYLRKFEEWALVSQGDGCSGKEEYLLRRDPSGKYRVIHNWRLSTMLACD